MLYLEEEPEGRDMATHPEFSRLDQVSHPCEENWEICKIDHEIIAYFEEESTFEGNEDLGKGCSLIKESDNEDL